jgi:hypothetical protein
MKFVLACGPQRGVIRHGQRNVVILRDVGQLVPTLPAPLSRFALRVYEWLYWRMTKNQPKRRSPETSQCTWRAR